MFVISATWATFTRSYERYEKIMPLGGNVSPK